MFLSTCNRVEVFACTPVERRRAARLARDPRGACSEHAGLASATELEPYLYERTGTTPCATCSASSASLDSMVLGEPQILGQVKDAYDAATAAGTLEALPRPLRAPRLHRRQARAHGDGRSARAR